MPKGQKQRKGSRRVRRSSTRRRTQRGGSAPVGTFDNYGMLSDQQGSQYLSMHRAQHGGAAPVGYTGMMEDPALRLAARITPLDDALRDVAGVRDPGQTGGRRRRRNRRSVRKSRRVGRKGRRTERKNRRTERKARRTNRKSTRRMRGGALGGVPTDFLGPASGPGMLLTPSMAARAGLHSDWNDVKSYTPGPN